VPVRLQIRAAATLCLVGLVLGLLGSLGATASADQRRDWSTTARLAPDHVDPAPPGVDVKRKLRTDEMLARAAARRELKLRAKQGRTGGHAGHDLGAHAPADAAHDPALSTAAAVGPTPAGVSALSSLTSHVAPACSGTGSDGNRVQVLYVVEADDPNRFTSVLPILRDEVANVDDTFAVSAATDGGGLRVRWVFDPATCQPIITPVTVRAGELASFGTMIAGVQRMGHTATNRKYLMFADAAVLCGVGHLILDDRPTGNASDGGNALYARVDTGCWQASSGGSVAAHELMHNLGGIQGSASHSTPYGHCDDDNDLMCYADGSGVPMRQVCPTASEPLFDCGQDDYFATDPAPGSYLATRWNTARSSFLETVAPLADEPDPDPLPGNPPTVAVAGPASVRPGLPAGLAAAGSTAGSYVWRLDKPACLTGVASTATLTVQCPSYESGVVRATVTLTAEDGRSVTAVHEMALTGTTTPLYVSLSRSVSTRYVGQQVTLTTRVGTGTQPVRGWIQVWSSTDRRTWTSIAGPGDTGADGVHVLNVRPRRTTYYQAAVAAATTAGWARPANVTTPVRVTRWPVRLAAQARSGRPDVVTGRLTSATSGAAMAGRRLVLQRRLYGASTWRNVGTAVTGQRGYASERVQPRRRAYFRWVYAGSPTFARATSGQVFLRY